MILTHGGNSISRGGIDKFIFYTDFSQIDISTQIDTPIIGGIGKYNNGNFYVDQAYTSGGPFNGNYVKIHNNSGFPGMISPYEISELVDEYSFECWMKRYSYNGLYINPLAGGDIFILGNLIHMAVGSGFTSTLYNGTTYHTNTSSQIIVRTPTDAYAWTHIATVVSTNTIKLYTNGTLRAEFIRQSPVSLGNSLLLYGTGSSENTDIGYISIREGDKSNNGESYTVPTAPYL